MKEKLKTLLSELSKNKIYSTIAFALSVVLLFTCCTVSFAWLVDYFRSGDVGFTAGSLEGSILEIAKVKHSQDPNQATEDQRVYEPCKNLKIEESSLPDAIDNGNAVSIDLEKLSFGMIDNVAMLKPENIVYFRLSIPKKNGPNVTLSLRYSDEDESFIELYENVYDGDKVTGQRKVEDDELISSLIALETEQDGACYINYSVCLSNKKIDANKLSEETSFTEIYNVNANSIISLTNDDIANAGDYYYVYVKVEPNLDMLSHSIEHISQYMPCYVYYKIKAEVEVEH
jgi:hypothetical protein